MALDGIQLRDEAVRDRIRLATEFLDPGDPRARSYRGDIVTMLNRQQRRLIVSIDDIRTHSRELADGILFQPFDFAPCFDRALKNIIDTLAYRAAFEQDEETMYYVAYSGSFGENSCNPRTLGSSLLNRMICLEGIVTRCSLVRPKVVKSVHWNENKKSFHFREYRDQTMSASQPGSTSVYPQEDGDGNPVCLDPCCQHDRSLRKSSFLQSTATAHTATTRPSQYKRCRSVLLQASYLEVLMYLWTTTWLIAASLAIASSLLVSSAHSATATPELALPYSEHLFSQTTS